MTEEERRKEDVRGKTEGKQKEGTRKTEVRQKIEDWPKEDTVSVSENTCFYTFSLTIIIIITIITITDLKRRQCLSLHQL